MKNYRGDAAAEFSSRPPARLQPGAHLAGAAGPRLLTWHAARLGSPLAQPGSAPFPILVPFPSPAAH